MQQRLPSLLQPPLLFAHRGARAHERENTIAAFQLAIRLGATGLESDVWITKDGIAVLDHDGQVGTRFRRRDISTLERDQLPPHIPTLRDLFDLADDHSLAVSLDIKHPDAWPVVSAELLSRPHRLANTYLCCEDFNSLEQIAVRHHELRIVDSSRLSSMKDGPERRLARLAELGVVGLNMHHSDWNGGLVALAHRFDRLAFAWDAQYEHSLSTLLRMGIDGVYSDWVDRMVDTARREDVGRQP